MKKYLVTVLTLFCVVMAGCAKQQSIGGDREEHGCLVAAGYSWDDEVAACIRTWELDEDTKAAAKIAVAPLSYRVTVTEVVKVDCEGCFVVHLQRNDNQVQETVNIKGWEYTSEQLEEIGSFEDCVNAGYPVMESYPRKCTVPSGETFIEKIEGHTCTDEEKTAEMCTMEYLPVCGNDGETYSNACVACASGNVDSWTSGECVVEPALSKAAALVIAQNSDCTEEGELTDNMVYNENTKTWWIDLTPYEEQEGCNPACVVDEQTETAEINWRCTGLVP